MSAHPNSFMQRSFIAYGRKQIYCIQAIHEGMALMEIISPEKMIWGKIANGKVCMADIALFVRAEMESATDSAQTATATRITQ